MWLLSALAIVFWLTVLQAGGSLALFADTNTTRSVTIFGRRFAVGPTDFAVLHGLLVIALLPLLVWGSAWLRRRNREPSTSIKMVWVMSRPQGGSRCWLLRACPAMNLRASVPRGSPAATSFCRWQRYSSPR